MRYSEPCLFSSNISSYYSCNDEVFGDLVAVSFFADELGGGKADDIYPASTAYIPPPFGTLPPKYPARGQCPVTMATSCSSALPNIPFNLFA
ncbi:hypothetical protein TNCT_587131 [Trichonephila clavata]|uniref:Uncharacterized protein n=1 Tax=Trichonephila clavata TaxID=2740835 RepID=A0A8X6LW23_TRICU|nr:hypothetical protein TNCT_587131 [Trichonephila clavata]